MGTGSRFDIVVVGAGSAGLAAALTAKAQGLDVQVFEAMERIGGRAYTTSEPFGVPWDAGCHWLHSASVNPFTQLADELGFRYQTRSTPWRAWLDGTFATADEETAIDEFDEKSLQRALDLGNQGVDIPLSQTVDRASRWYDLYRLSINAEWGVDPEAASTLDVSRYRDLDQNWPVEQGYGALVAQAAASAVDRVELRAPVANIATGHDGVRVTTPKGTVEAEVVIVTASTNVLRDGVIAFDPPLTAQKQEALSAVPLGSANKVALQVEARALAGVPEQNVAVPIGSDQMISLRFRPFGRNLVDGYVGGPVSEALEAAGPEAFVATAMDAVAAVLGNDVRQQCLASTLSRWGQEPFIRGAYAAAKPGEADRRAVLREPHGERVMFAGEATSPDFFTTCHGAWESGIAAALDAARILGRRPAGLARSAD